MLAREAHLPMIWTVGYLVLDLVEDRLRRRLGIYRDRERLQPADAE